RRLELLDLAQPRDPLVRQLTHRDRPLGCLPLSLSTLGELLLHAGDRRGRQPVGRALVEEALAHPPAPAHPPTGAVSDQPRPPETALDLAAAAAASPLDVVVGLTAQSGAHDEVVRGRHGGEGTTRVPR